MGPKFSLGRVVATTGAIDAMECVGINAHKLIKMHSRLEQGALDADDHQRNIDAVKHGDRIFSAYNFGTHRFWVITEHDRSATTILLPGEY